jgi:hypothetical protein
MASKKKKDKIPKIPEPQQVTPQTVPQLEKPTLQYQPFSFEDYGKLNDMIMQQQFKYAPQIMDLYNLSAQKNAAGGRISMVAAGSGQSPPWRELGTR